MKKLYKIVKIMLVLALYFTQNNLQAQKCCVECQADVKVISDKQMLLEKIDLKAGTLTTNINTNLYVSYRSGNTQKFWTNLVIATAGVAVSTQLNKGTLSEGRNINAISPLLPLGVSVASLPGIWKNRPRAIPQAGLYILHRDTRGKLIESWEQPISSEAKNDAELLTVSIDKPLSAGTLEVYLQNDSKNGVYYWGYGTTSKSAKPIFQNPVVSSSMAGCPDGYLPNGNGMCCNPFTGDCVGEGGGGVQTNSTNSTNSTCYLDIYKKSDAAASTTSMVTGANTERDQMEAQGWELVRSIGFDCNSGHVYGNEGFPPQTNVYDASDQAMDAFRVQLQQHNNSNSSGGGTGGLGATGSCPSGYLPNGQGMCCNPFTGQCIGGGGGPTTDSNCIGGIDITNGNPCYDNGGGGGGNNNGGNNGSGNPSPSDLDRMERRTDVDDLCNGYKRLWNNSFRNNDPVLTKEMGGYLTSNGKIILLPSYDNSPTTTSFKGVYLDQQAREILYVYTQQGQLKADVTIYDQFGQSTTTTYNIIADIHTHPYNNGNFNTNNPSQTDKDNLASDTSIKHYILAGNQLIEYNQGGTINTTIPCP